LFGEPTGNKNEKSIKQQKGISTPLSIAKQEPLQF